MNIFPADPWVKGSLGLNRDTVDGDWNSEQNFHTCKAHQPNESIGGKVATTREHGIELGTVFVEGNDSQDSIGARDEPNNDWWNKEERIYGPDIVDAGYTANIFVNVKSMALIDIFYNLD